MALQNSISLSPQDSARKHRLDDPPRRRVLTLTGCMAGLAAFAIGSKLLQSNLYRVSVFDPLTMGLAPSTLILVALLACYGPARRAMLSDPMVALRYE